MARKRGEAVERHPIPATLMGESKWAIRADCLPRLIAAHDGRLELALAESIAAAPPVKHTAIRRASSQEERASGAVAVISLAGVMTPRPSFLSYLYGGGAGLCEFRDAFRDAVASSEISAIVLNIDSPGGLISLVPETAAEMLAARGEKPVIAVANTMAASGAYWLAAMCDEIVCTPSGEVGSVGVYMLHNDYSGMNERIGVDPTFVYAGKYKTEGNIEEPLSSAAKQAWQGEIDDLYAMFTESVAAGRDVTAKVVRDSYGEGRTLLAARAKEAGMCDRVDTLETVISELLEGGSGSGRSSAARITAPSKPLIENPDQTRCSDCGAFVADGAECAKCAEAADDDDDEDEDDVAPDDAPDDDEEPDDDDEDEDDEEQPVAQDAAVHDRRVADLLFS